MIAKLIGAMSLGPAMFLGADIARADHGDLPIEHHEGIFLLDGIGAGEVFEDSFPTEFAPDHGKSLRLTGSFYNQQSTQPINLTFGLTWFDPRLPGGQQSSTPESYEVLPAGQVSISTSLVIPFTPEQVGVHIQNDGPGEPLVVSAVLTHRTTMIPEPSAGALGVIGLLATAAASRRIKGRFQGT